MQPRNALRRKSGLRIKRHGGDDLAFLADVVSRVTHASGNGCCLVRRAVSRDKQSWLRLVVEVKGTRSFKLILAVPKGKGCEFCLERCILERECKDAGKGCAGGPAAEFINCVASFASTGMWALGETVNISAPRLALPNEEYFLQALPCLYIRCTGSQVMTMRFVV